MPGPHGALDFLHSTNYRRVVKQTDARFTKEFMGILLSERDRAGNAQSVSSSLPLISRLVEGIDDPETLIEPLSHSDGTIWDRLVSWKPRPVIEPQAYPEVPAHDEFEFDLLSLCKKDDGTPRAQSPSRLEKLLVSPLAWASSRCCERLARAAVIRLWPILSKHRFGKDTASRRAGLMQWQPG